LIARAATKRAAITTGVNISFLMVCSIGRDLLSLNNFLKQLNKGQKNPLKSGDNHVAIRTAKL